VVKAKVYQAINLALIAQEKDKINPPSLTDDSITENSHEKLSYCEDSIIQVAKKFRHKEILLSQSEQILQECYKMADCLDTSLIDFIISSDNWMKRKLKSATPTTCAT